MIRVILFALVFAHLCLAQTITDLSDQYEWKEVKLGAGGYVTGIDMHIDGNVLYCRTDVGGAYRLDAGSKTWIQLMTTETIPGMQTTAGYNSYGVQSIVSAPSDENIVYMVFGDGNCYRSENKGDLWAKTSLNVYVEPNGTARFQGERLAVDPLDSDIVYYGSHQNGLQRTVDGGATWQRLTPVPDGDNKKYGVGTVVIDTTGGAIDCRSKVIYATVHEKGVYKSVDGGKSWTKLTGGPADGTFEDAAVAADGAYYVVLNNVNDVWKYKDESWTMLKDDVKMRDIACDPTDAQRLLLTEHSGFTWRSIDGGATWKKQDKGRESPDIPWHKWCEEYWFSNAETIFDTRTPGNLWIAQGIGVWTSDDFEKSKIVWDGMSMGIEELVVNDILSAPGQVSLVACWDRAVFYLDEPDVYQSRYHPTDRFNSGWDLAYCEAVPEFVVATITDHRSSCFLVESGYSEDGGKTWHTFESLPEDASYGTIAVSATDPDNIVWLPTNNVMPYITTDRGKSWTKSELPGTSDGGNYVHSGKQSNVTADAVTPDLFYLYHRKKGIYRSEDKGMTWELISTDLPINTGKLSALRAVPGHSGHFYFSAGSDASHPLYYSSDGCLSWDAVEGTSDVSLSAFGKPADGLDFPTLYIYGKVQGDFALWRSIDQGESWDKIGLHPLGLASKIVAIEGDKNEFGKVWVGFPGNGLAYGYDRVASAVEETRLENPCHYELLTNYPNPFNPITQIEFKVQKTAHVSLSILDINGRVVDTLINQVRQAGSHKIQFDAQQYASGVYLCRLELDGNQTTRKMTLMR